MGKELCWASWEHQTTTSHASAGVCQCGAWDSPAPPGRHMSHPKPSGEGEGQGQEGLQGADQGVHTAWQQGASGRKSAAVREGHHKARATKLYTELVTWHFAPTSHLASTQRRGLGGAVATQGEAARTGGRGSRWPSPSLPLLELQVHRQRLPSCKVTPQAFKKCPLHQQTPLRSWLIFRETGDPWS